MLEKLSSLPLLHRYMAGGVVVLGLLVLIPTARMRGIVVLGCVVAGLLIAMFNLGLKGFRKRKVSAFDKGLKADVGRPGRGKAESRAAVSEVSQRWNQALAELKQAGLSLYDLPWYLLIGEPQSGKSTTLRNSGLEFPVGTEALSGAGGTRNCDWWFTNEAIILDTAGRFTFQEKNAPDAEEWKGFLKLLSKNRSACPINGVVLTIPATSLLSDSEEERENKARNIREKLTQIQRELGVQFPVFILITKSDQILGFTEFFSRLGATEQRQLTGWSMHGPFIQAYNPDGFHEIFQALYERIHKWRLKFLGEDTSLTEIDKLYVFPEEFKSLEGPLYDYLKSIFVKSQFLQPLFFRGFYFTSGLQQGKPVARACAQMIRSGGAGAEEIIDHLQKIFERSRAFFIRDFYLEKLFPERNLVIHSEEKLKIGRKLGVAAIWGSAILLVATLGFVAWRGWQLRQGIGAIEMTAGKVHSSFLKEVRRTADGDAKPLSAESAADAVKLSARFDKDSRTTVKKFSGLETPLRDMYWLYFLQCCLQDQGRMLYTQLAATAPGASLKEPVSGQYSTYSHMWSLSANWLEHTQGETGTFDQAKQIKWPAMMQTGISDETQKLFKDELEHASEILAGSDLDFSGKGKAVVLPLIPGETKPSSNKVIAKEIEAISAGFKPVDPVAMQGVIGKVDALRNAYAQAMEGLSAMPCGYVDPQTDPYATARSALELVRKALGDLDQTLAANKDMPRSMATDRASIEAEFRKLAWTDAAVKGSARKALDEYIKKEVDRIFSTLDADTQKALQKLNEQVKGDVVVTSGTLARGEALAVAAEGLARLEALLNAQGETIVKIATQKIPNADEAKQVADLWPLSPARKAAGEWAAAAKTRVGLDDRWKVGKLAGIVGDAAKNSDEAVRVEAWLAYARTAKPGALLSRAQISSASLSGEPPAGARPEPVMKAQEELNRLAAELGKFKEGVVCAASVDRLRGQLDDIAATIKDNHNNFLAFWKSAYRRWEPAAWIGSINTWDAFKTDPLMQATALSQRVKRDLQVLVANVQGYKDKGGTLGDLGPILSDLQQFAQPGSVIEQNANLFSDTVGELSANKLQASVQLSQAGASGMERNKAIDTIGLKSSSLNSKFEYYPKKVRALLDVGEEFQAELERFMGRWARDLAGKFPFAVDPNAVKVADKQVTIPQADAKLLHDFFFGAESLPVFIDKYKGLYEKWSSQPERAALREFFDECLTLRRHFFDEAGSYKPIKIEGTYTGFDGKRSEDLREISERIDLLLPTASPQPESARWRSQVPGSLTTFTWTPGNYGEEHALTFRSMLDRGDNPNKAELRVAGDFSVLAYIVTQSSGPEADRRRWPVKFGVTPEGDAQKTRYKVSFIFVFEKSMPKLPDWAAVAQWTK